MYFMSTVCGRPQGGEGGLAHVDACGQLGGQKRDSFVDVINGWPLIIDIIIVAHVDNNTYAQVSTIKLVIIIFIIN